MVRGIPNTANRKLAQARYGRLDLMAVQVASKPATGITPKTTKLWEELAVPLRTR
ncbi:hypothetical protein GCM10009599_11990 [Luteococcus peritonei]